MQSAWDWRNCTSCGGVWDAARWAEYAYCFTRSLCRQLHGKDLRLYSNKPTGLKLRDMIYVFGALGSFWEPARVASPCCALPTPKKMRRCLRPPVLPQSTCYGITRNMRNAMYSGGWEERA